MSPYSLASWGGASEFHCPECGHGEAYRSLPRDLFEKYVLPLMMLRPVRCDRCYRRSYVLRSVPARLRATSPGRHIASPSSGVSHSRIA